MQKSPTISINGRVIGHGCPPYVIAELSANHNGDLNRALSILESAKLAGADAVKLQTYTADTLTIDCDRPEFVIGSGFWEGQTLYELYRDAAMPWEWHEPLFARGRELGITVFSTPFDHSAVDYLEKLNAPAYKIASFELIDLPLINRVAATGKPIIMSTGMASLDEIKAAVDCARQAGGKEIAVLHCISGYPTPPEEANLSLLLKIATETGAVIGLSDHTMGHEVAIAAVSLGASIIEKHVTLARADGGPDSGFSLEPDELKALCESCSTIFKAIGDGSFARSKSEATSSAVRRSLYVVADIPEGGELSEHNIKSIRPGLGLAPKYYSVVLGQRATRDLSRGSPLCEDDFKPAE